MVNRYSSRLSRLDESFLNKKLIGAKSYDRIAGYFCSSILEVAGESIEAMTGTARVICNSGLSAEDVETAAFAQRMKQEWCSFEPENKYTSPQSCERLTRLYRLLKSDKLQVRVIPDEAYGLMHGKAGIITYENGTKTSFLGSINETKSAFQLNYEMVWEDDSPEAVDWVQKEFDFFWNNKYAVNLCDFIVEDIDRLSKRTVVPLVKWREQPEPEIPAAAVEEPVFRKEFGLWEHQKYFVELAFREHQKPGGARYLLADQVGLGKTIQLAMAAKLMALSGDKPILIIVPKTLLFQWQDEMNSMLDMPSAVWTGHGWQDETGYFYQAENTRSILKCPRRVGIVSQGLVSRRTEAFELLLQKEYECVILDEAHRARRRNPTKDPDTHKADPNYLLQFLNEVTYRTKSMLLATATPVQVNTIEAYDLINALSLPAQKVMGDIYSEWHKKPQLMLDMVCSKEPVPESEITMWDIMRNPFPERTAGAHKINSLRDSLDIPDDQFVLSPEIYTSGRMSIRNKIKTLYITDKYVLNFNPYIRHIVRRTRDFLENTINPSTGEPYLKKIDVLLLGEHDDDSLPLEGYQKQAYQKAQEFCSLLSKRVKAGGFMSTLMLKRIGSTILAGENTAKKMLAWTEEGRQILEDEFDVTFEDDEDYDENVSEVKELTPEETECLRELVAILAMNHDSDPKYGKTLEILQNGADEEDRPWKDQGCIVFSQYYDSAHFIAEKLSLDIPDTLIGLYAGGDKSGCFINAKFEKKQKEEIKAMVKERKIKILVGTDAASEGLNLQTLSTLINLDLPWNPTRLEQRKGRIQRIGQISDCVRIFNMRYKDSVEDKVHKVLSNRLNDIYNMFGQIPDTLEDVWIDIALDNEQQAQERIDAIPKQNPFSIKYETIPPHTENWEACTTVLDKQDKMRQLMRGW
jgi:superfamily II DNA or RNA helicase